MRTNSKVPASGQLHALGADASRRTPKCCGDRKPRGSQGNFCGTSIERSQLQDVLDRWSGRRSLCADPCVC